MLTVMSLIALVAFLGAEWVFALVFVAGMLNFFPHETAAFISLLLFLRWLGGRMKRELSNIFKRRKRK